jgi:hypothetical protein
MTLTSLIKLINSLSSSEKRYVKMHSQCRPDGRKEYLVLFDLLDKIKKLDLKGLSSILPLLNGKVTVDRSYSVPGYQIFSKRPFTRDELAWLRSHILIIQ